MKPSLLALSFLLLAFITNSRAEPVLDTDDDPVRHDAKYYIIPRPSGSGGGLRLAKTGSSTCPVDVIQDSSELSSGQPLVLQTIPDMGIIPTDKQVKVTFADIPDCAPNPSKWILPLDSKTERSFVRLGIDRPIYRQLFQIVKNEGKSPNYKFVYCPGYIGVPRCFDVGIRCDEDGIRHLAAPVDLDDHKPIESFNFVLKKASSGEEAEIKMKTTEM